MELFPEFAQVHQKKEDENTAQKVPKPLALRLSPQALEDFSGQEHVLSPGKLLRRAIEFDRLGSVILFGPPGTGKSALARLVAKQTQAAFVELNAVTAGVADLRREIEAARLRQKARGQKTILLVDEIHHFNRSQQDALLPDVERGTVTLFGITSENPFFYVNSALRSRSQIFEFFPLAIPELNKILERALSNSKFGLGQLPIILDSEAKEHLLVMAAGDARRLLNALEVAALSTAPNADGKIRITLQVAEDSVQRRSLVSDKRGDEHYDTISAFIKSMRGSDPDAAVYWLVKMLEAGEDPRFLARRILICASEDVGNADPMAVVLAQSVFHTVELIGMPEARIPLSQAAIYIALAPKSNASYLAVEAAYQEVRKGKPRTVPNHLKDATADRGALGHGQGYQYPHNFPNHWVDQVYWTNPLKLYNPSDQGEEPGLEKRWEERKKR